MPTRSFVGCLITLLSVPASAIATPIASEPFDIAPGQLLAGTSGASSFGWSGPWGTPNGFASGSVVGGSLQPPAGTESFFPSPVGNSAFLSGLQANTRGTQANLTGITSLWGSFLAQPTVTNGSDFSIGFTMDVPGFSDSLAVLFTKAPGSSTEWGVGGLFTPQVNTGNIFTDGVDAVVFELVLGVSGTDDLLRIWFDAAPTGLPSFTMTGDFGSAASRLEVGFASQNGSIAGSTLAIDEIRVGTTLADVTAVPEPTTIALFVMAALGFAARACRRR